MKKYIALFILISFGFHAKTQDCNCLSDFNFLVSYINKNYPGLNDKIKDKSKNHLSIIEKDIKNVIKTKPDSCYILLKKYTSYFKDNHLRVTLNRSNNPSSKYFKPTIKSNFNFDSLKATSNNNGLEGIWKDYYDEFAITKEPNGKIIGIALNFYGKDKGEIIWEFIPTDSGTYQAVDVSSGLNPIKYDASLHLNGKVLEIHDYSHFIRKTDNSAYDLALAKSYIPNYPNGVNTFPLAMNLSDSTFYLRIPSFAGNTADKLVQKHWLDITSRPNLIIDIRNNGGGNDYNYQILLKLLYTNPYDIKGVEWYATPDNIKVFEDALASGNIKGGEDGRLWTAALLSEMKKNMGKFVVHPLTGRDSTITRDTIYSYPKRVGIIINENNASSAEQFLLSAKQSKKVILFGNKSTAGVLDYSNAIKIPFPSGNYSLIYPMTRSRRLPNNPIDNIGITPSITIPYQETTQLFDRLDSWVYFVMDYIEYL